MACSFSSGCSHRELMLMLQLRHQVGFPENSFIAMTDYSYRSSLGGRFGYFYFFCSGEGKGEFEAPGGGGGVGFLLKISGGGGVS